jgi:hypothetical protein
MRVFPPVLSFLGLLLTAAAAQSGTLAAPGPSPTWTEMQKFEWYLGYMSRAANTCGSYVESGVLLSLARMTPYGDIGLGSVSGDGFAGPVCGRINNEAKELVADAERIREYLEAAYNCTGEACYGQKLSDWQSHSCAEALKSHLANRSVGKDDARGDLHQYQKTEHHFGLRGKGTLEILRGVVLRRPEGKLRDQARLYPRRLPGRRCRALLNGTLLRSGNLINSQYHCRASSLRSRSGGRVRPR